MMDDLLGTFIYTTYYLLSRKQVTPTAWAGSCTSRWTDYNPSCYNNNIRNDLCDSSRANGLSCLKILYLAQWPLNSRGCIHFLVSILYFFTRLLSNNTKLMFSFLCFGAFPIITFCLSITSLQTLSFLRADTAFCCVPLYHFSCVPGTQHNFSILS